MLVGLSLTMHCKHPQTSSRVTQRQVKQQCSSVRLFSEGFNFLRALATSELTQISYLVAAGRRSRKPVISTGNDPSLVENAFLYLYTSAALHWLNADRHLKTQCKLHLVMYCTIKIKGVLLPVLHLHLTIAELKDDKCVAELNCCHWIWNVDVWPCGT